MAEKNGYRAARTGRGTEALTQRKADVEARKAAEHIYSNLNTFTLGGDEAASASNVSLMTNAIHIQETNQDALETANTINEALFRSDGGPIPGTCVAQTVQLTDNSRTTVWTPGAGETWQLISASSVANTAPSGSLTYYLYYLVNDQNGVARIVYSGSGASGSTNVNLEDLFEDKTPQFVDENVTVQVAISALSGVTTFDVSILAVRVR